MGEAKAKNTLIVQFPAASKSSGDRVIEIEETLIQAFEQNRAGVVDGHDFGTSSNIFIFPRGPWDRTLDVVMAFLKLKNALSEVLVIKRLKSGACEVVWPRDFAGEFEEV